MSLSIREVADRLEVSERQVRNLIKSGKLRASREEINSTGWRYVVTEDVLEAYQQDKTRTRRKDGRNKYVIYLTPTELTEVRMLLTDHELSEVAGLIVPSNDLRS